ncbi:MAG: HPP family protein, partial [Sphingobacterium sp.]
MSRLKNTVNRHIRVYRYIIYKETLVDFREHFWSFFGALIGIGLIAYLQSLQLPVMENVFLLGSFGASAVLV